MCSQFIHHPLEHLPKSPMKIPPPPFPLDGSSCSSRNAYYSAPVRRLLSIGHICVPSTSPAYNPLETNVRSERLSLLAHPPFISLISLTLIQIPRETMRFGNHSVSYRSDGRRGGGLDGAHNSARLKQKPFI